MKPFAYSMCFLLYLLPHISKAQSKGITSQQSLFEEVNNYHQKYLLPVYQQQRQKFNQYLDKNEIAQLHALSIAHQKFTNDKYQLLNNSSIDGNEFMDMWESLQQEEVRILLSLEGLIDKYFFVLQKLLKEELKDQIQRWRKDLNGIISKYNANVLFPKERFFAKYGFGKWSDPVYFVIWQAKKPNSTESAADMGKN